MLDEMLRGTVKTILGSVGCQEGFTKGVNIDELTTVALTLTKLVLIVSINGGY